MIIPEQDVSWEENEILWIAPEVGKRLDKFGAKDPDPKCDHRSRGAISVSRRLAHGEIQRPEKGNVLKECKIEERGQVDCIDAPWLRSPYSTIDEKAS